MADASSPSTGEPGPAPSPERFVVDFNPYVAGEYNRDFGGTGTLEVRTSEPRFVFRARRRRWLTMARQEEEFAVSSAQIRNVKASAGGVSFETPMGKSGVKKKPFVFACETSDAAERIAALLPTTRDPDYSASADFAARLGQLPSQSGLGSLTLWLISANSAAFVAMGLAGAGWLEVDDMQPFIRFGANHGAATTDGEWWRLVSAMFLHFGLLHLLLNLWALFQVGPLVERLFGSSLYAALYFGSGLAGSLATIHWNRDTVWSAGASGAVFGVYGAVLGYLIRERHAVPARVFQPLLRSTLIFAGVNLVYGATNPHIDNAAHIGGLAAGLVLGWICALPLDLERRRSLWRTRFCAAMTLTVVALGLGAVTAPRFNYRIADELAWARLNEEFAPREKALLDRQGQNFNTSAQASSSEEIDVWLNQVIDNYEGWTAQLRALALAPNLLTAQRRDELLAVLTRRLVTFRNLKVAVLARDPDAVARFHADDAAVDIAIKSMRSRPAKP